MIPGMVSEKIKFQDKKVFDIRILERYSTECHCSNYKIKLIYYMFNGNVPYIDIEPVIASYGIEEDYINLLEDQDRRSKRNFRIIYWCMFFLTYLSIAYFDNKIWMKDITWKDSMFTSFWIVIWLYPVIMEISGLDQKLKDKIGCTPLKKKVETYKRDKAAYTYWEYQKKYQFWAGLTGYEFEDFVGQVFLKNNYTVHATKKSGDGGIDLVIEKENIRIAVQCKAHSKAVGPSVVRDLYGTMNHFGFNKGMLVSLNGFISGVYTFVKDKEIELISVHELIKMSGN